MSEEMNSSHDQYGTERNETSMKKLSSADLSAQEVIEHVTAGVRGHVGDAPQHDDMTMVVIKVL